MEHESHDDAIHASMARDGIPARPPDDMTEHHLQRAEDGSFVCPACDAEPTRPTAPHGPQDHS